MKISIIIICLLIAVSARQSLTKSKSSLAILQSALHGVSQQNTLPLQQNLQTCMDEPTAQRTVDFINKALIKGYTGSSSQLQTLIDDVHTFYDSLDEGLVKCLNKNEYFLKLNYKYGIGYLPLAQEQFRNYTKTNYLKLHQRFGEIYDKWVNQQYQQSGYLLALYGHEIFPITKKQIRGVWLTNVASSALDSFQNIQKAVEICSKAHINTIYVVVYNNARTIYPSQVMQALIGIRQQQKFQGRDPLNELIYTAKKYNIEVHAWFQYGFSSSYNAEGGPIIAKKPSWKALDSSGKLVVKNGFDWLNGFDPQVQQFMIDLVKEVISNYDVDGVQGDDRLPALPSTAGYESYTVQLYKQQHGGKSPPSNYTDQNWIVWRMNKLNQFMKRLYFQVKRLNPKVMVTVAPSPYPWSKYEYLQDWPTWAKYGWIDAVIPQCYRYNITAYQSVLQQQLGYLPNDKLTFASGVLLNVGDYVANLSFLSQMVNLNRNLSLSGESFFYYEGVSKQLQWFQNSYQSQRLAVQTKKGISIEQQSK